MFDPQIFEVTLYSAPAYTPMQVAVLMAVYYIRVAIALGSTWFSFCGLTYIRYFWIKSNNQTHQG